MIQNDVQRFCENRRIEDRVPIKLLHKNVNLISLKQRRCKQLLALIIKCQKLLVILLLQQGILGYIKKSVFRVEPRFGTKYSNSPFYKGTKLWDT